MSRFNRLKRWLGLQTPEESAMGRNQPGQRLMTLDERMAFRREMVFEAVREVLAGHGVPALGFKINVARLDNRGHRYAVMIDLLHTAGRVAESSGEWQAMEVQMTHAAESRYRVKVSSVYWRIERHGFETSASQQRPVERVVKHVTSAQTSPVPEPAIALGGAVPANRLSKAEVAQATPDGFPDTVLEERHVGSLEPIGPDELLAFEEALRAGQSPRNPLRVGSKTYQTDFMPLA